MNRNFIAFSALAAAITSAALAQTANPLATAPATAPATTGAIAPAPQAIPAKVALVAFEQAVLATNEGQRSLQEIQKKYEPRKAQIDGLNTEVDSLKKQLQSAPATLSDEERATRLRTIDTKEKQLTRDGEDAQTAYNTDLQEAYGKIAQKVSVVVKNYCQQNGFTLLLDVGAQGSNVMWAGNGNADITQAVVTAYNASSGIAAPPPSAPSAARPRPSTAKPPVK